MFMTAKLSIFDDKNKIILHIFDEFLLKMYIFAEKRRGNGTKPLLTPYQTKEQVDKPRITDPIKDQPKSRAIRANLKLKSF